MSAGSVRLAAATIVLTAGLLMAASRPAAAHPGHGTMALVGTLAAVEADAVTLEVRDTGSGVVTRRRVRIDGNTKLRQKKDTLASLTPWVGASAVATVDYEEGPDGVTTYYATKIQISSPKAKR